MQPASPSASSALRWWRRRTRAGWPASAEQRFPAAGCRVGASVLGPQGRRGGRPRLALERPQEDSPQSAAVPGAELAEYFVLNHLPGLLRPRNGLMPGRSDVDDVPAAVLD